MSRPVPGASLSPRVKTFRKVTLLRDKKGRCKFFFHASYSTLKYRDYW